MTLTAVKPSKRSASLAALLSMTLVLLLAETSSAHIGPFYPWWHPVGIDDVPVYFDSDFPVGRARSRVRSAAFAWNGVNRRMYFKMRRSPSLDTNADTPRLDRRQQHCPTPARENRRVGMMHWGPLDNRRGGIAAMVGWCWKKGDAGGRGLHGFRVYFDREEAWYTRSGTPVLENKKTKEVKKFEDLWSIATHELGHATGWRGHWQPNETFCQWGADSGRTATMCPHYKSGTVRWRTLSGYDKHVFRHRYAPR